MADYSRFTVHNVRRLLECGGFALRELRGAGNVLSTLAYLSGVSVGELGEHDLDSWCEGRGCAMQHYILVVAEAVKRRNVELAEAASREPRRRERYIEHRTESQLSKVTRLCAALSACEDHAASPQSQTGQRLDNAHTTPHGFRRTRGLVDIVPCTNCSCSNYAKIGESRLNRQQ
eukprot:4367156-Prymnesium_polylepis.2